MNEFDPLKVNFYSIEELVDMVENGVVTKDEIYACGLSAKKRPELEAELTRRQRIIIEDDEAWSLACRKHTVDGYDYYLRVYDKWPPEYRGKYVAEAKAEIEVLRGELDELRQELFQTMLQKPWIFKAELVKKLLSGEKRPEMLETYRELTDISSRFLASGQKITYQELIDNRIIPSSVKLENLVAEDANLIQTNINDLGDFPEEKRTDVYFFGVPRGGKSSVLAGILSNMDKRGVSIYQPHWNHEDKDMVRPYYFGLIDSTKRGKFPESTVTDSISFMKIDLELNNRQNLLTFVEIGGEAFRQAYLSGKRGALAWGALGAGSCLKSKNRKMLIFILDYSLKQGGINSQSTEANQMEILRTALDILSSDGTGKNYEDGCTLSKVDTVAVIVTKSDLMSDSNRERRNEIAIDYIEENFAAFMKSLEKKCERFGINKATKNKPYVMAFSLGKFLIGNTYAYDATDSENIVNFISNVTTGARTGFFGRIFGNI